MHSIHGNYPTHQCCGCYSTPWIFYHKTPKCYYGQYFSLPNGYLVHRFHKCNMHLSLWYYHKGLRIYRSFTGDHMNSLWKQLTAAGAASGKPGDHGRSLKWLNRNHNSKLRQATASGHEPRSQAEGRTHQNLRSVESISRRLQNYCSTRQLNRCNYRK